MKKSPIKALEHGFKRVFSSIFYILLKKGRSGFSGINPEKIKKVLFLRPDKLGDMVVSLPVFHNLKKLYPHLELYLICSPRNISVIRNDHNISKTFLYTKHLLTDIAMIRKIRRLEVEVIVDLVSRDSVTALFLGQLCSRKAVRIGRDKRRHARFYDLNYTLGADDSGHAVDSALELLNAFGIKTEDIQAHVPPAINDDYMVAAERYQESLNGDAPGGMIGLNISAGRPTRVWPEDKNIELIGRLLETYPACHIVISSDPSEWQRAVTLAGRFSTRVDPLPGGLNLLEVSAIISRMKLLITPDTSLVHIARSFRVPVVGLYTGHRNNLRTWRPYNQECGPVVSDNVYNVFDIEVDDVMDAVTVLLPPGEVI